MKKLLLIGLCFLGTLQSYAVPVTDLMTIDYPIVYDESYGAYSDGHNIILGKALMKTLTEDEQGLVILHEAYHNVLKHSKIMYSKIRTYCSMYNSINNPITAVCKRNYEVLFFFEFQENERQADLGSFRTAKRIGYTQEVCQLFIKLKKRLGEVSDYSTHPTFEKRYNRCMRELK